MGTAPKFGLSEEIEFVPVFTSSKQRRKRKFFTVVFVQVNCKEKRAGRAKFVGVFSFTYWVHCRRCHRGLRCCSQDLSTCVNR